MKTRRQEPPGRDAKSKRPSRPGIQEPFRSFSPGTRQTRGDRSRSEATENKTNVVVARPAQRSQSPARAGRGQPPGRGRRESVPEVTLARQGRELAVWPQRGLGSIAWPAPPGTAVSSPKACTKTSVCGRDGAGRQNAASRSSACPGCCSTTPRAGRTTRASRSKLSRSAVAELEDILAGDGTILVLDHLQDPQNVGTLLRAAEAAAVAGVVIPEDRAAGITPGRRQRLLGSGRAPPRGRGPNLARALEAIKRSGRWVAGLDAGPEAKDIYRTEIPMPAALVVGAEGAGLSAHLRSQCDLLLALPMRGRVELAQCRDRRRHRAL